MLSRRERDVLEKILHLFVGGIIRQIRLPNLSAALLRDNCEQETNDLSHKAEPMLRSVFSKHEASLEIPVAAFARRSERIFVESSSILSYLP